MRARLFTLVSLLATTAIAGDLHTQTYEAEVGSVRVVKTHAFDDRLGSLDGEKATPLRGGPACELRVDVAEPFFKGSQVIYASVQACDALKTGAAVRVQYLGIATAFQFVSMQVDGVWRTLTLMKRTASKNVKGLACLSGEPASGCAPEAGPVL